MITFEPRARKVRIARLVAFGALLALGACKSEKAAAGFEKPAAEDVVNDGRSVAEAQCAVCHAVGVYGESPNPAAPPFRIILSKYHADVLEEELIAGIRVAHPMPEFQFNPKGVDALIAYLKSIQQAPAPQ
jgi:mono/diheme cytochrome c family protein